MYTEIQQKMMISMQHHFKKFDLPIQITRTGFRKRVLMKMLFAKFAVRRLAVA